MTEDTWKKFSYDLITLKDKNVEEEPFHEKIEDQLQILGWAKYLGEINHKLNIPIGNNRHIQPDIIVGNISDPQFVIEVKRPDHELTSKDIDQLASYMRQLKLPVGLFIGSYIEVLYDRPNTKGNVPNQSKVDLKLEKVYRVELELEKNSKGEKFVELFSKDNFSHDAIRKFCEERLKEKARKEDLGRIRSTLLSDNNTMLKELVLAGLMDKYSEKFSSEELSKMLNGIDIVATTESKDKPVVNIKNKKKKAKNTVEVHLEGIKRYAKAQGIFDGKGVTVLKGSHLAVGNTKSFDKSKERDALLKEIAVLRNGYWEMMKDYYFSSPSKASDFCLGRSSNGRDLWTDKSGRKLGIYFNSAQ